MKFKIQQSEFLKGLGLAQSIADRKSTMPMLANVLLRTTGQNKLLVAATDLNVSISAELVSENSAEGGLTVGAKILHDIVSDHPNQQIVVRADNNWAEIEAGKVDYRLVGMPDRDFPKIPDTRDAEFSDLDAGILREMIDRTLFSVSNDETRFHLNGVLFESDGKTARMVSTDGHRLSKVERTLEGGPSLSTGIIIPKKGVQEIKKVIDSASKLSLAVKTPYLYVRGDDMTLAVKLIESQFPPYEQAIPKQHTKEVVLDRRLLLGALNRGLRIPETPFGTKVTISSGQMVLTRNHQDVGEVREKLEVQYSGESMSIGFNSKYVIDLLMQMSTDQVTLELNGEIDPGLLRPLSDDDYFGVVMPVRQD